MARACPATGPHLATALARASTHPLRASRRRPRIPGSYRQPGTLLLLPSIPDELDDDAKDALALRNACSVEGRCPDCGAVGVISADASSSGIFLLTFEHEADCGALTDEALER